MLERWKVLTAFVGGGLTLNACALTPPVEQPATPPPSGPYQTTPENLASQSFLLAHLNQELNVTDEVTARPHGTVYYLSVPNSPVARWGGPDSGLPQPGPGVPETVCSSMLVYDYSEPDRGGNPVPFLRIDKCVPAKPTSAPR